MKKITALVEDYLAMRAEVDELKKMLAATEAALLEAMESTGIKSTSHNGTKVTLVNSGRPSYDVDLLQQLVSPTIFKMVVKAAVDSKKWKAAVELGKIKADVADAVVTVTPSKSIRVTAAVSVEADEQIAEVA